MNAYKEKFGKDVQVLLLQNHGIFVAANTVEEIGVLFDGVISKLEKQVKRTADVSEAVTPEKEQAAQKLSRVTRTCGGSCAGSRSGQFRKGQNSSSAASETIYTGSHCILRTISVICREY